MPPYKHLDRYRQIVGVLADEGFDNMLDVTGLRRFQPVTARLRPEFQDHPEPFGVRLRHTLERLGPTFVKVGQVASTRPDIIPDDVVIELRKLQDDVAPFPDDEAFATIEAELGAPIKELFAEFDRTPIAAASLGQVYAAVLPDGTPVAVKVRRPNVEQTVETDLDILRTQARFIAQHSELAERYDVVQITDEFADAVRGELDYLLEGTNCERLGAQFAEDTTVKFPAVYWELTTPRVLTTERLFGLPFNRPERLTEAGYSRAHLAKIGIYCYLEQIFVHGFYHADPHPGNLFALDGERVGFTDFGRCGTISKVGREQLADLFMAIIDDDAGLAVDTLLDAAGSPGDIDVAELERNVSRLITKYYNKSLAQIRIGELIGEVLDLVREHHLMLSSELAMLLTTLVVLEGLGRLLDPNFDFVAVTAPFARRITTARMAPQSLAKSFSHSIRRLLHLGQEIPESLGRLLRRAGQGEFRVAVHPTGFEPLLKRFEEATNRLAFALVVASFVIGLSMLLATQPLPMWFTWVARAVWAGALFVGTWFFVSILAVHYRHK
jgi:ubiquinone biosynthesis protein